MQLITTSRIVQIVTLLCVFFSTDKTLVGAEYGIPAIPAECHLQAYDDGGELNRQPHIVDGQSFTFDADKVEDSGPVPTVAFGSPHIKAVYPGLNAESDYFLTVTYVTDTGNKRVQRLSAGSLLIHDAYTLPESKAQKLFFRIPSEAISPDGTLSLTFECLEGPNAVVSEIELWGAVPSPFVLHLEVIPGIKGELSGFVTDIRWHPVDGSKIVITDSHGMSLASDKTDSDGSFYFSGESWKELPRNTLISIIAGFGDSQITKQYPLENLYSGSPIIRPVPEGINDRIQKQIVLDGTWQLIYPVPSEFPQFRKQDKTWKKLKVPGQLLQQGYDIPADQEFVVLKQFKIPALWSRSRLFIRFESIHANTQYWLNGKYLGKSEHLYTPVEFEITDSALADENVLALKMKLDSVSEQLSHASKYAFHNLCGLDRSVTIFTKPQLLVQSLHIETILDDDYLDAELVADVQLDDSVVAVSEGTSVKIQLYDRQGKSVASSEFNFKQEGNQAHIKIPVNNPFKWDAEKTYLYTLKLELLRKGKAIEVIERKVGFRDIRVKYGQLLVNGTPVKLAGANRHEIDPYTGRADTVKHARKDAELFKAANINYIRTSHYPPTREFLDACDEIGLYVEVEAPFCWTRTKRPWEENPEYAAYFMRPTAAMVEYHRNHPSVILWSLGNESGYAFNEEKYDLPDNYIKTLEFFRKTDPTRPVCFNNEWARDGKRCDIAILHYQDPPFKSLPYLQEDPRPIILDEYWHVPTYEPTELAVDPGTRVQWGDFGSLEQTIWNRLLATRNVIGGAIWGGIDEIFFLPNDKQVGYGPWGILDSWRREKPEYWIAKSVYSPVWIPVDRVDYNEGDESIQIPVENRYSFTNLSELKTRWQLGDKTGEISAELAPLSKGHISIPVSVGRDIEHPMVLRFFNDKEQLVVAKTVLLGAQTEIDLPVPSLGCPQVAQDENFITITGKTFKLKINKENTQIVADDSDIPLLAFPRIHATRKEVGWVGTIITPYTEYPDVASRKINFIGIEKQENAVAVIVHDEYDGFKGYVKWLIDDAGQTTISFNYHYSGEDLHAREVGVRLMLDENCQTLGWKRQSSWGPFPDDHIGRTEGTARAFYDAEKKNKPHTPDWPWSYDSTDRGSNDFRSSKFNIYSADITNKKGNGLKVHADGTVTVRASVVEEGVQFHVIQTGSAHLTKGSALQGEFNITLIGK